VKWEALVNHVEAFSGRRPPPSLIPTSREVVCGLCVGHRWEKRKITRVLLKLPSMLQQSDVTFTNGMPQTVLHQF
jgi:hypothetical protein